MPIVTSNTNLLEFFENNSSQMLNVQDDKFAALYDQGTKYKDVHGEKGDNNPGTGIEETSIDNSLTNVADPQFVGIYDAGTKYKDVHGEQGDNNPGVGIEEVNYTNTNTAISAPGINNPVYVITSKYGDVHGEFIDESPKEGIQIQTLDSPDGFGSVGTNVYLTSHPSALTTRFTKGPYTIDNKYKDVHGQFADNSPKEGIQEQTTDATINPQGIGSFGTNVAPDANIYEISSPYTADVPIRGISKFTDDGSEDKSHSLLDISGDSTFSSTIANDMNNFDYTKYLAEDYSDLVKVNNDNENLSPIVKFSMTGNSLSPLQQQYKKFNLRKDSPQSGWGGPLGEPFILRGIQDPNVLKPQRWFKGVGIDIIDTFLTWGARKVVDILRIGKYMISPEGIAFLLKHWTAGSILMSKDILFPRLIESSKSPVPVKKLRFATTDYVAMTRVAFKRDWLGEGDVDFRKYIGPLGIEAPVMLDPTYVRNWDNGSQAGKTLVDLGFAQPSHPTLDLAESTEGDKTINPKVKQALADKITDMLTSPAKDTTAEGLQLIKFWLTGIGDTGDFENYMYFRATLTGISDSFSPTWNPVEYIGRPSAPSIYQNTGRTISFNFKVYAQLQREMMGMWNKLNKLASYCYPKYDDNNRMSGPMMSLTIGDLYVDLPGWMTSLSYTFPDDEYWDIEQQSATINPENNQYQLPRSVDVAVSFTPINHQLENRANQLNLFGAGFDIDKPAIGQDAIKYFEE